MEITAGTSLSSYKQIFKTINQDQSNHVDRKSVVGIGVIELP